MRTEKRPKKAVEIVSFGWRKPHSAFAQSNWDREVGGGVQWRRCARVRMAVTSSGAMNLAQSCVPLRGGSVDVALRLLPPVLWPMIPGISRALSENERHFIVACILSKMFPQRVVYGDGGVSLELSGHLMATQ